MKEIYKKLFEIKKANIKLQRDTKAFNYKYATLSQIQEKLSWEFEKLWLLVIHAVIENSVETSIIDTESWELLKSSIKMSENIKAQDKWSEITYYRRYNLLSLLDLETEDDDWKKQNDELEWIWDKNIETLKTHIAEWKKFTLEEIRKKYKISTANKEKLLLLWIK